MSESFTLSKRGELQGAGIGPLTRAQTEELRRFFLSEAGIWSDPKSDALVIPLPLHDSDDENRCVLVVGVGAAVKFWERGSYFHGLAKSAKRYFAAHPVQKPWETAQYGEVWVLTVGGVEAAYLAGSYVDADGVNQTPHPFPVPPSAITAGTCVWKPTSHLTE